MRLAGLGAALFLEGLVFDLEAVKKSERRTWRAELSHYSLVFISRCTGQCSGFLWLYSISIRGS